ncbi:uncharacterized protein EMH_0012410 [Eimeria mitis]|uniref:Uncharacterized protein n=1 Tax=Eimeria mitis TaxID=44415 RepID=U6KAB7_9EIME|nr:uncharacterized protein EMH_0012410 [Eimeria mitis]CDJ32418.1 hypothetical protein EMH_0012410 [Eimeria mitis]
MELFTKALSKAEEGAIKLAEKKKEDVDVAWSRVVEEAGHPALTRELLMLEPPIALQSTWDEELAQLDTMSSERIGKMRRMDFGRQRKGLHRRTKGCVLENNEIWKDFLGVDEVILGEELRRRADAIERVKMPGLLQAD